MAQTFAIPVLGVLTAVATSAAGSEALEIVRSGRPMATVVCADNAGKQLVYAVGVLRECIKDSTGAELPLSSAAPASGNVVYVGPGPWVTAFGIDQEGLDADGFDICFPDKRSLLILGPTNWGTEFGVYEFLERYVGVRWLMPGPVGTHIPQRRTIGASRTNVRQAPAFFARYWSGLRYGAWMRTARMPFRGVGKRMSFHHNLARKLFPTEIYKKKRPEFFPLIGGKRLLPRWVERHKWQPCFSSPGVLAEAVKNITRYFDKNPAAATFSLGINDTGADRWCQCEACQALYDGRTNSLGKPDYSDVYYGWCGRVIEAVLAKHPDKWFGCLVYNNTYDPPKEADVHARLVPYICMDRMQWADAKRREIGHAFHERWREHAPTLGWYDYIYGSHYKAPRVYCHLMADYLRYAKRNGVRAYYAEAYPPETPAWSEGPKLYVTSRLLWDPDLDVDALLHDWYVSFAGKDAAEALARYFTHWEQFWTQRVLSTPWFGDTSSPDYRPRQYLDFKSTGYFDAVTPRDLGLCRQMLGEALAKTRSAPQRARVQLLLNAFGASESAMLFHRLAKDNRPPAEVINALLQDGLPDGLRQKARGLLNVYEGDAAPVSLNASFEDGGDEPENWMLWVKPLGDPPYGAIKWITGSEAQTGDRCLLVKGLKRGGPVQAVPVEPGQYVLRASYLVPAGQTPPRIEMNVTPLDAAGKRLRTDSIHVQSVPGQWRIASRHIRVPAKAANRVVTHIQFSAVVNNMAATEEIYFDNIGVYRLPE